MSSKKSDEAELLIYSYENNWNSFNSITTQRITKLAKSESHFAVSPKFDSNISFKELEICTTNIQGNSNPLEKNWELDKSKSRLPRLIQTRSLLRDEMEMLKINMSAQERALNSKEIEGVDKAHHPSKVKKKKKKKFLTRLNSIPRCWNWFSPRRVKDLMTEIEGSETAKTDKVVWKFLKRGSSVRKELTNGKRCSLELQDWISLDFYIQNAQPLRITCPNCTFYITTNTKKVSTMRTKLLAILFAIARLCIRSRVYYSFKDTVHLCPLCRIYLGFCPAIGIQSMKKRFKFSQPDEPKEYPVATMVSASSTSAKNLFVESKIRLSDRVQVNVNNIAAIARQIQKGSKANENLIAAAKNFALQEAAIENSETNLKKLKLLTTNLKVQINSVQSNSSKMELVLEQVRSMQR